MIQHETHAQALAAAKIVAMMLECRGLHDVHIKERPGEGFLVVAEGRHVEMHKYAVEF